MDCRLIYGTNVMLSASYFIIFGCWLFMKEMKIILNDSEIVFPIRSDLYEAICDNSEYLTALPPEFIYLLKQMIVPSYDKASLVIGDAILDFQIERYLLDYLSENKDRVCVFDENQLFELHEIVRKTIPYNKRPPSQKQISYVIRISEMLNIDIPAKVLKCSDTCSSFIDTYQYEYQEIERFYRDLRSEANRVSRWFVAFSLFQREDSLESIAEKLGVVREATIEKYMASYVSWKESFLLMNEGYQLGLIDFINDILEADFSELNLHPIKPTSL